MNQHSRFNLPLCMAVEEDIFEHVDQTVFDYLPEIKGKKAIFVTEKFLNDTYPDTVSGICQDFGGA